MSAYINKMFAIMLVICLFILGGVVSADTNTNFSSETINNESNVNIPLTNNDKENIQHRKGHKKKYLVKMTKEDRFIQSANGQDSNRRSIDNSNFTDVISTELNDEEYNIFVQHPNVEYVEIDSVVSITNTAIDSQTEINPSDSVSWGLRAIGGDLALGDGKNGENIKVAIMDTGISDLHPDLSVSGGASFIEENTSYRDDHGHGTQVAGIVAAKQDLIGIIGAAPRVELYALKVLDSEGIGSYSQVIEAIHWCMENDIDIINMSFGGTENSQILHETIQAATAQGILFVAAAGNAGSGVETELYPALYPEVVSVGAMSQNYERAVFSSTGLGLDLISPGVEINSTYLQGGYRHLSGTSAAAPFVSGSAAVLLSTHPEWKPEQIKQILYESATPLGAPQEYGHGLINLAKGLGLTDLPIPPVTGSDITEPITPPPISNGGIQIQSSNMTGDHQTVSPGDAVRVSLQLDGQPNGSNPHSEIEIKVYKQYSTIPIQSYTYNNPPLKPESIVYTWQTLESTAAGTYSIVFHYPASPNFDDVFTVYVRPEATVPDAPTGLQVTSKQRSISLTWDQESGIEQYYVRINNGPVTALPGSTNSYTFEGLSTNKEYSVSVAALNSNHLSLYSQRIITTKKEIVFFIPGIAATTLKNGTSTVWLPSVENLSSDLDKILLDRNGVPLYPNVKPDAPMAEYYESILNDMRAANFDVVAFGYDFRLSNTDNASILEQKINNKMAESGANKISIVAHSMGGLIAAKYIAEGNSSKIDKLISLGTPYLGAPKALYIMKTGNLVGNFKDTFINDHLRNLAMKAKSVYDLLPSENYFELNNTYYAVVTYNRRWNDRSVTEKMATYSDTKWYIRYNGFQNSEPRLEESEVFHNSLNLINTLQSINSFIIVGNSKPTPGKIYVDDYMGKSNFNPINGDGTVPLISATIANLFISRTYFVTEEHSALANNVQVRQQVLAILANENTNILSRTRQPNKKSLKLKVECPVELHIYDSAGNHMGPTADKMYEENIPSGSYYQDGDMKFAFASDGNYDIEIIGTDVGMMTYTLQRFDVNDNAEKTVRFENVPITTTTIIRSNTNMDGTVSLQLDANGDGQTDQTIMPTDILNADASLDDVPPTLSFDIVGTKSNDWYSSNVQATINAQDLTSGVHHIEYKIGDSSPQIYNGPIQFTQEGQYKLQAIAFDKNGNSSLVTSVDINLDKLPPTDPILTTSHSDWTKQDVNFTIHGSEDSGSGIRKYQYKLGNGDVWLDYSGPVTVNLLGETDLFARAMDISGHISEVVSNRVKIDKKAPTAPKMSINPMDWTADDVIITVIPGTDLQSGVKKTQIKVGNSEWEDYINPTTISSEGLTLVYARSIDYAGNISIESVVQTKIDRTEPQAPTMTATSLVWSNHDVVITISDGIDQGSGIRQSEYKLGEADTWKRYEGPFIHGLEGELTIFARSIDKLGHQSTESTIIIRVDKTLPIAPVIQVSAMDWTNADVHFTITGGSDALSGLWNVQYKINDGEWTEYQDVVTLSQDGQYVISVRSVDKAGNNSKIVSSLAKIDKTAPLNPKIVLSNSEWTNTKVTFSLNHGEDLGSGFAKSQYKIGSDGSWTDYTLQVPINIEGQTQIYSHTIDHTGNISSDSSAIIRIDRTLPSVPTALRMTSMNNTEVNLMWDAATDNTFVKGYEIYRNNVYVGYSATTDYKVTGLKSKTNYIFTVCTRDAAGNLSAKSNLLSITTK